MWSAVSALVSFRTVASDRRESRPNTSKSLALLALLFPLLLPPLLGNSEQMRQERHKPTKWQLINRKMEGLPIMHPRLEIAIPVCDELFKYIRRQLLIPRSQTRSSLVYLHSKVLRSNSISFQAKAHSFLVLTIRQISCKCTT